jgi:hypothetical protein
MRKIINGRVYDTDIAFVVGEYASESTGITATLYWKRTNEYFLHCNSKMFANYGVLCNNYSSERDEFIILVNTILNLI